MEPNQIPFERKFLLRGELGERFGREWSLDVNSVREGIHAIDCQRDGALKKYFLDSSKEGVRFAILINGKDPFPDGADYANDHMDELLSSPKLQASLRAVDYGLRHPIGQDVVEIIPVPVAGGDDSGMLTLILGIVLMVVSIALIVVGGLGLFGVGFSSSLLGMGTLGGIAQTLGWAGLLLAISGAATLIVGPQSISTNPIGAGIAKGDLDASESYAQQTSKNFSGPVNTTGTGRAIPLVVGRAIVGSHLISFGIHTTDDDERN